MSTAVMPDRTVERGAERHQVFVVDAFDTALKVTDQLLSEGYKATVCPSDRARSLMIELEGKGTDLVLVHVRASPYGALDMLRAAFTVCRLRSPSGRPLIGVLTAAPEPRFGRAPARA